MHCSREAVVTPQSSQPSKLVSIIIAEEQGEYINVPEVVCVCVCDSVCVCVCVCVCGVFVCGVFVCVVCVWCVCVVCLCVVCLCVCVCGGWGEGEKKIKFVL